MCVCVCDLWYDYQGSGASVCLLLTTLVDKGWHVSREGEKEGKEGWCRIHNSGQHSTLQWFQI